MQQEAKLCNEYEKMMATAEIPFDGKTLNLYGVQKYFEHEDREMRKAAVRAYAEAIVASVEKSFPHSSYASIASLTSS